MIIFTSSEISGRTTAKTPGIVRDNIIVGGYSGFASEQQTESGLGLS